MHTIGFEIEQVVENVNAGGKQAESDEGDDTLQQGAAVGHFVRSKHGYENEDVFRPLMGATRLAERGKRARSLGERNFHRSDRVHRGNEASTIRDHNRPPRQSSDREIDARISRVIELAAAELLLERPRLGLALQIDGAVARNRLAEKLEMLLHLLRDRNMSSGDEDQLPPTARFGTQVFHQLGAKRQTDHVGGDATVHFFLEKGTPFQKPEWTEHQRNGGALDQKQERLI